MSATRRRAGRTAAGGTSCLSSTFPPVSASVSQSLPVSASPCRLPQAFPGGRALPAHGGRLTSLARKEASGLGAGNHGGAGACCRRNGLWRPVGGGWADAPFNSFITRASTPHLAPPARARPLIVMQIIAPQSRDGTSCGPFLAAGCRGRLISLSLDPYFPSRPDVSLTSLVVISCVTDAQADGGGWGTTAL